MCNFLVTIVMLISNPTPKNTLGTIEVNQYYFKTYIAANKFARSELLAMGAGLSDKKVPRVNGVDLQEMQPFDCKGKAND